MAKGPGLYARDIDIGKPTTESNVKVTNLSEVVAELKAIAEQQEEATGELQKIVLGVGTATGTDLNEEDTDA